MKCPKCTGATSVLETRSLAPDKTKRFRACTQCPHRFETVEMLLVAATRARITPSEIRRRRDVALAMPYLDPIVLALQLGCSAKTIRSIRARAATR